MDFTIISRLSDGFPLTEGWDPGKQKNNKELSQLRYQAGLLIKEASKSMRHQRHSAQIERQVIDGENARHRFYSSAGGSLIVLCVFESSYPKNLALVFLEEIRKAFLEEIKREHGASAVTNYSSFIETATTPYQYIRFDRVIQKKRLEFKDPRSQESLKRLNQSLNEVSQIMQTNITDLLLRGENLEGETKWKVVSGALVFAREPESGRLEGKIPQFCEGCEAHVHPSHDYCLFAIHCCGRDSDNSLVVGVSLSLFG
eukprot:Gregarina_sp_Pseudo_9__1032@NODE_1668_length_1411_cov_15_078717_g1546_i0_p1_GENE_NODE_1668_length_1411_cov_15_078717_g1546_i0NODE_1668_length_1411_cov_15_078717_g1546_i0_p1_ORF_typecomplete_len257_score20_62Longin/PF13774_6/2_3e07Synaptobrevin/PF00957_21/7_3e03Synaptobrevin/PF00957_21/9_3e07SLM4/PF16818_5/0_0023Glyco_transf_88/PF16849_5/3_4e03Glyco_transf_88/PF16849_5/0_1_NODE_1668_length_1411_cov_15_078717_g1546_i05451315